MTDRVDMEALLCGWSEQYDPKDTSEPAKKWADIDLARVDLPSDVDELARMVEAAFDAGRKWEQSHFGLALERQRERDEARVLVGRLLRQRRDDSATLIGAAVALGEWETGESLSVQAALSRLGAETGEVVDICPRCEKPVETTPPDPRPDASFVQEHHDCLSPSRGARWGLPASPDIEKRWGYATEPNPEQWRGSCATREAAIAEGRNEYGGQAFYVTSGHSFDASAFVPSADELVDQMEEKADDEAGDLAGEWPDVTAEAKSELDELLVAWLKKHVDPPSFWEADGEVERIEADEGAPR